MNIAFGTVLTLFLLSPGFALRHSFLQGPYARKVYRPTFTEEIFWSIIPAVVIQLIGILVLDAIHNFSLIDIYHLLIGADKASIDFERIKTSIPLFLIHQTISIAVAILMGYIIRVSIFKFSLDKKISFLKIKNDWYYLFSGRILDAYELVELVQVDVLVHSAQQNVIYCGILDSYFLSPDGSIDKIYLSNVYRRNFHNDPGQENEYDKAYNDKAFDERYYNMPGEYFIIFGKEILNINVTYYYLVEEN